MNNPVIPPLTFMDSIKTCFSKYANCSGRARRSEFWYFYALFQIIMVILISCINAFRVEVYHQGYYYNYYTYEYTEGVSIYLIFVLIVDIALLIPIISASTRRLHDTGKSGLFYFIIFIPFGIFVLWYLWSIDSVRGANIYGPTTKYNVVQADPLINNPPVITVVQPGVQAPVTYGQQPYPQVYPPQQISPIPEQPNVYQGPPATYVDPQQQQYQGQQSIPIAQPNMYPNIDPQGQPPVQTPMVYDAPQNPPTY